MAECEVAGRVAHSANRYFTLTIVYISEIKSCSKQKNQGIPCTIN